MAERVAVFFYGLFMDPEALQARGFRPSDVRRACIERLAATAALAGLAVWLLFAFFWQMLVPIVTMAIAPPDPYDPLSALHTIDVGMDISRLSPNTLFSEATLAFLSPTTRALGPILSSQVQGSIRGAPLPLGESLVMVRPQLTALLATVILLFVIAYILFQRQEVRA